MKYGCCVVVKGICHMSVGECVTVLKKWFTVGAWHDITLWYLSEIHWTCLEVIIVLFITPSI